MSVDHQGIHTLSAEVIGQNSKKFYAAPTLTAYGHIADCTLAVGHPGHVKGGGVCFHIDKHGEMSGMPCS